jgi:hypothetical protein
MQRTELQTYPYPWRAVAWLLGLVFLCIPASHAEILWNYETWFAVRDGSGYQRSDDLRFGCDDEIYLFVASSNDALADRSLVTRWENPSTGLRHRSVNAFQIRDNRRNYWSWGGIAFVDNRNNPLDLLAGFLDPAAGQEAFIGEWRVEARVDGLFRREFSLQVLC